MFSCIFLPQTLCVKLATWIWNVGTSSSLQRYRWHRALADVSFHLLQSVFSIGMCLVLSADNPSPALKVQIRLFTQSHDSHALRDLIVDATTQFCKNECPSVCWFVCRSSVIPSQRSFPVIFERRKLRFLKRVMRVIRVCLKSHMHTCMRSFM